MDQLGRKVKRGEEGSAILALRLIDGLKNMLQGEQISPERQKPLRTIREFGNYIAGNRAYIPDYGGRHRSGERISSAFAESAWLSSIECSTLGAPIPSAA